jgi:hypothetical protein
VKQPIHPVITRYAAGEISALRAASLLGDKVTVGDVIMMLKAAGLTPPRPSADQERRELAHARRILALD